MNVVFFSDTHKHYNKRKTKFIFTDVEFEKVLKKMSVDFDKVVSLGDLIELWAGKLPFEKYSIESFYKITKKYPLSYDFLIKNVTIVPGNHDRLIRKIIPEKVCSNNLVLKNSRNEKLIASHGVYDFMNRYLPGLSHLISWVVSNLSSVFGVDIEHFLSKTIGLEFFNNFTQLKHAKKEIKRDDSIVVVVNGHTHKLKIIPFIQNDKVRYFVNTGRFNGEKKDLISVNMETFVIKSVYGNNDKTNLKNFILSLKKGDIILTYKHESLTSKVIATATKSKWSHVVYYIGGIKKEIVDITLQNGIAKERISKYLDGVHNICVLRPRDGTSINEITKLIKSQLGKRYSVFQILLDASVIALSWMFDRDIRKDMTFDLDKGYKCSGLIAWAVKKADNYDFKKGITYNNIHPGDIYKNKEYTKEVANIKI